MPEFWNRNASAVFGLIGVCAGGILSFVANWLMRKRDLQMKIWERFLDRRISAHENVIGLAMKMRVMVSLNGFGPDGELARAPKIMSSKDAFDQWLTDFARVSAPASTWLAAAVKRELNFVQDYMVTLHTHFSGVVSEHFLVVGRYIRQDFIDLSAKLERVAFEYFKVEAMRLQLGDPEEHHKYLREETDRRFRGTVMVGKWDELQALIESFAVAPPGE